MGLITRYHTYVDGKVANGLISAARLNGEFDSILGLLNGNIEDTNIKVGAKILCTDRAATITAVHTFSTMPVLPAAGVADSKLSANVALLTGAQEFTGKKTFHGGIDGDMAQIENLVVQKVVALPTWSSADIGRVLYCTGDGKFYGGGSVGWNQLDYTGAYTGGSVRSYSINGITDSNDSFYGQFKTEGVTPSVKIALTGLAFPARFYTELGLHTHAFTGDGHTHVLTDAGHTHSVVIGTHGHTGTFGLSNHTHTVSGTSGNQSANHTHSISGTTGAGTAAHTHSYLSGDSGTLTTGAASSTSHTHTFSDTSGNQSADHTHSFYDVSTSPSTTGSVADADLGTKTSASSTTGITAGSTAPTGTNADAGVNGGTLATSRKQYGKSLQILVDDTDITETILSALGWVALGDGTGSHALHSTGTGELNISAMVSFPAGYHTLEVREGEAGYGCGLMIHIETA
jgi:hypothetical protein